MANSRPVIICVIKQMPRRDPKFHQAEILDGVGRSIRESLMTFSRGWFLRKLGAIGVGSVCGYENDENG